MAQVEPMDIDTIDNDFDNKENAFQYNNVLSRTPCTEKGYEELDVSELNMKLRYSITPASSPMSKSLTGPCLDNKSLYNSEDYLNNTAGAENGNLTRSLNSTLTNVDGFSKSKVLPLQTLSVDPCVDTNKNSSLHRLLDPTDNNVIISVNNANDVDENISLPSTCSSVPDTPEATTPTKETPKPEGSPIMRGLKSVLSMFRPSQSPILPADDKSTKPEALSPIEFLKSEVQTVQVSTPVLTNKQTDANSSKRSSPLKESLVFNDDLERELLWKNETTIIFKDEKIPVHKLFFQNPITEVVTIPNTFKTTVEHMDISCDESVIANKTNTNIEPSDQPEKSLHTAAEESDNEFLDCETTFTKNAFNVSDYKKLDMDNEIQITHNLTVDLLNNPEISGNTNTECQSSLKSIVCVIPDLSTSANKASMSASDVIPKRDRNYTEIIEATINLLSSEIDYSNLSVIHNLDLQNRCQINKDAQLEDPNIAVSVDQQLIKDNGLINYSEIEPIAPLSIQNNVTSYNLKGAEVRENESQVCSNADNKSQVCGEIINIIESFEEKCSETLHRVDTKEKIEIVHDIAVTDINIVRDDCGFDNVISKEMTDVIGWVPNIENLNMTKSLGCTQFLELESIKAVVTTKEHVTEEIPVVKKNFTDSADNYNNVEGIFNDYQETMEDIPVTLITKSEDNISEQGVNEISVDIIDSISIANNSYEGYSHDIHKINESVSVTWPTKVENDMLIKTISLPVVKDVITTTNSSTTQFGLNDEMNATTDIGLKSEFIATNVTDKSNDEKIIDKEKELLLLQNYSEDNMEPETVVSIQTSDVGANSNSVVNIVSGKDYQVPELIIESDTVLSELPSEVPLPDDNDNEQNMLGTSSEYNDECSNQANPLEIVDGAKCDLPHITLNSIEDNQESLKVNSINEYNSDIINNRVSDSKKANKIKTYISQTAFVHVTENKTIDLNDENMKEHKGMLDLQIVNNNSLLQENTCKDISMSEVYHDMKEDAKNFCEDTENKSLSPKTNLGNNEEYDKCIGKSEDINSVKIDIDNQVNITVEKAVEEADEDLITSANNSPYVSVTDLDIVGEKIINDTLRDNVDPFALNNKVATSPPISPKIVSKGYNFIFDEMDDPFATKTKIRMSPTRDTPNQTQELAKKCNRRISQSERKKPVQKKHMNSTFSGKLTGNNDTCEKYINSAIATSKNVLNNISTSSIKAHISELKPEHCVSTVPQHDKVCNNSIEIACKSDTSDVKQISTPVLNKEMLSNDAEGKSINQVLVISTEKSTSSSEQYFSLGTSSGDSNSLMNRSKNVFNLPEIDDMNFSPFATKTKVSISPPPAEKPTSSLESTKEESKSSFVIQQQPENNTTTIIKEMETLSTKMTKDLSPNRSDITCSSKNTNDIDTTFREILTEDEDTIEGPYLEMDLKDTQKFTDVEVDTDMMNFNEIPQQERDENLENDELFIDADAFEFLLNQNKSTTVLDSGKESLFLKFDPLFAKRISSDGILAALSKAQKRQSTPKKVTKHTQKDSTPIECSSAGPSNINENSGSIEGYEDLSSTVAKPMMVVNPAVSSIVTQRKSATPKLNRRSLTFTSPAIAAIDRLLSLSGNSSYLDRDAAIPQTGRQHSDTDLVITQLRELLAEKEINVHSLRSESKELKDRLSTLEVQVRGLETESADRLAKINELNERLLEKTKMNKSMAIVVEEYERTIASLIAETEHDKKRNAEERMRLINERDEQTAHLRSMEVSFSDLHSKYEKSKQLILSCKANEDIYKKSIKEFQDNFSKMQNNYELLKQHATSKLNHANHELEKMNRAHEAEVLKMNAMIKRKELHITSLEETLAQKTKANEELTAICDELINKVG